MRVRVVALMLGTLLAPRLHAQDTPPRHDRAFAGALVGAAGGLLLGGVAGLYIGGSHCSIEGNPDSCHAIDGMLAGAGIGVTLGTPIGAHLLNRRQGAVHWSLLSSVALAAAGVAAVKLADDGDPLTHEQNRVAMTSAIVVPLLQIVTSTLIEARARR